MKNIFKKNQMIITALAIMIAVAGYLNYSGSKLDSAKVQTGGDAATEEASAAEDISAEDLYAQTGLEELQFEDGDIASLDSDGEETAEVEDGEEPGEAVLANSSAGTGLRRRQSSQESSSAPGIKRPFWRSSTTPIFPRPRSRRRWTAWWS